MMVKKFSVLVCHFVCLFYFASLEDAPEPNLEIAIQSLGSTRFLVYRQEIGWIEARDICKKRIGRLAVLPTKDDADKLVAEIRAISTPYAEINKTSLSKPEFGMDRRYWIGLSDLTKESVWDWVQDGGNNKVHLDYDYWYPAQPDTSGEHCVTLWNPVYHLGENHTFNDENCGNKHYFICEETDDHKMETEITKPEAHNVQIAGRSLGRKKKKATTTTTKPKKAPKKHKSIPTTTEAPSEEYELPEIRPEPTTEAPKPKIQPKNKEPPQMEPPQVESPQREPPTKSTTDTNNTPPAKKHHTKLFVSRETPQKREVETEGKLDVLEIDGLDNDNEIIEMSRDVHGTGHQGLKPLAEEGIEVGDLMRQIKDLSASERSELLTLLKEKITTTTPAPTSAKPKDKPSIASIGLKELLAKKT